jgi:hypothetical protein
MDLQPVVVASPTAPVAVGGARPAGSAVIPFGPFASFSHWSWWYDVQQVEGAV